jgi:hypothetical protein
MSHWTKVKTKLSNLEHVKKAITRLGYEFQEGNFKVTEYGTTEKAELLLDKSLGLSLQEDGTYAFVGDPYHCRTQGLGKYYGKLDKLTGELSTAYAIEEAKYNLEQQNFFCTDNAEGKVGEDGLIHMCFESYS